jgi:dienelactone hydrolase
MLIRNALILLVLLVGCNQYESVEKNITDLEKKIADLNYAFDEINKNSDDLHWYNYLQDIAYVEKVEITGPPIGRKKPYNLGNNDSILLDDPLIIQNYIFIPKSLSEGQKHPLIIIPHGGLHGNFSASGNRHIVREFLLQGYSIAAPEYRGSSGYGKNFHQLIDYGGLENDDVKAARDYMIENFKFLDAERVGLAGWSHGGMIGIMNLMFYPQDYAVAFASVPVSDLNWRMKYKGAKYEKHFASIYHIGKTSAEAPEEYENRSPVGHIQKLQRPLMILSNSSDANVRDHEVEKLVNALKKEDKDFIYSAYINKAGGHFFDRLDTRESRSIRLKMYLYLNNYLSPQNPFKGEEDMDFEKLYFKK